MCMSIAIENAVRLGSSSDVVWASPTFDQSRTAMDETRRAAGGCGAFNESRMSFELPNGGRILYRSLDKPDTLRSKTAGLVIVDEAPFCKALGWHEVIRPMLIDTGGGAWLIGTPQGKNWYWQEWQNAQGRPDWATFHAPTLGAVVTPDGLTRRPHALENPNIPFSEIVDIWRTTPDRVFRQEILAEFVDDGGGVFRGVRAAATAEPQDAPIAGHHYAMGVDWGRSNDFTVITVIDTVLRSVVRVDRMTGVDWHTQLSRLEALAGKFRPYIIFAEGNSMGGPLAEELMRRNLPISVFTTTNASKRAVIDALALAFERSDVKLIADDALISELEAFEVNTLPSGTVTMSAPAGMHDDCVMSLAIGWQACSQGSAFA